MIIKYDDHDSDDHVDKECPIKEDNIGNIRIKDNYLSSGKKSVESILCLQQFL